MTAYMYICVSCVTLQFPFDLGERGRVLVSCILSTTEKRRWERRT